MSLSEIHTLKDSLTVRIRSRAFGLALTELVESYVAHLDNLPSYSSYNHVSEDLLNVCKLVSSKGGNSLLDDFHKLVLATLIERFEERVVSIRITGSVRGLFVEHFRRILSEFATNAPGFYQYPRDVFLKDLAICSLRLIPVGVQYIDAHAGLPRSLLVRAGPRQFIAAVLFFLRLGGFKPLYQIHADPRTIHNLNPETRSSCLLRTAKILQLNPHMLGMFGGSWFYDPHLETVSPRLSYLRSQPPGAQTFYVGKDKGSLDMALAKSQTRRRLYEEGKYVPASYLCIWPRRVLISWARKIEEKTTQGS